MKKIKVLLDYQFNKAGFTRIAESFDLIYPKDIRFSKEEVKAILANEDIEVYTPNFATFVGAEILDCAKSLKLIANFGVGYDNIDVDYATKKGIVVTNTPQSVLEPTAETAFAHILATSRKLGYYNNQLHQNKKLDWSLYGDLGLPVYGTTLGIYGMGRIGQAVARRANAFGMKVIYYNRTRLATNIEEQYLATYVDFETLLAQSDFLSLHAPFTPETQHIINADTLRKMKSSAILINTARGALVDEEALAEALKNKVIAAAGLDVFEHEPKISPSLIGLNNVVLTPHMGTKTMNYRLDMQAEVEDNIINFYNGGTIRRVN